MRLQRFSHFYAELGSSSIQKIDSQILAQNDISLFIKRDDLLHPIISGNKWRKLKHLILEIESKGITKICAMGGAYSNLLHSLAYLGRRLGWQVELIVRGYPEQALSPTLQDAVKWGATIRFANRVEFRNLRERAPDLDDDVYWIPEGGFHQLALKGTAESLMEMESTYDFIVMATATGASLAGLSLGANQKRLKAKVKGISVLNNADQVRADIGKLLPQETERPEVISGYDFGGYAKSTPELFDFIEQIETQYNIPLEPVYSGKSFYAVMDLVSKSYFPSGSKVLLIHCGGLQGKRGFE